MNTTDPDQAPDPALVDADEFGPETIDGERPPEAPAPEPGDDPEPGDPELDADPEDEPSS